ncbi:hypothetical protein [Streptomyces sp. NPDC058623]|uniref:hypothetical protein n=1 Tax=Streptomyces sp. NPDC058623 TaxID=3346563 RepID=UPI00365994F9
MARADENKALALLSAIVAGDADIQDGVAELKKYEIESTGDLLSELSEGIKAAQDGGQTLNFDQIPDETPRDLIRGIIQIIPEVPFILNGTMYDPKDIVRFNGQELHFVASLSGDHMLAIDDRNLFARWRQITRLEQYLQESRSVPVSKDLSSSHILLGPPNPMTGFNEHINFEGDWLNCRKNRGFRKLGSWNDEISSFKMVGTQVAELHEHVDYLGQSWSKVLPYSASGNYYYEEPNLHRYGWGDRASSVGTW